jgi:hypothetical protein
MRRAILAMCVTCFLLVGCSPKIHPAFYDVVRNHRVLLDETNDAVIASIRAELDEARDRLTADQIQSIENLIERLEFLKSQGVVIERYVETKYVDEDLISELIRHRWTQGSGRRIEQ